MMADLGLLGFNRRHLQPMAPAKVYARQCFNLASIYRHGMGRGRGVGAGVCQAGQEGQLQPKLGAYYAQQPWL